MDTATISIRPDTDAERSFILATYLNGNFYGDSHLRQEMPKSKNSYYKKAAEYIIEVMGSPGTSVDIACLADDPSFIFGYLIHTGPIAVWCHVKEAYRCKGILNALLKGKNITSYNNFTKSGQHIAESKGFTFITGDIYGRS